MWSVFRQRTNLLLLHLVLLGLNVVLKVTAAFWLQARGIPTNLKVTHVKVASLLSWSFVWHHTTGVMGGFYTDAAVVHKRKIPAHSINKCAAVGMTTWTRLLSLSNRSPPRFNKLNTQALITLIKVSVWCFWTGSIAHLEIHKKYNRFNLFPIFFPHFVMLQPQTLTFIGRRMLFYKTTQQIALNGSNMMLSFSHFLSPTVN